MQKELHIRCSFLLSWYTVRWYRSLPIALREKKYYLEKRKNETDEEEEEKCNHMLEFVMTFRKVFLALVRYVKKLMKAQKIF